MPPIADSGGDFDDEQESFESYEPEVHPEAEDPGVFWCPKCGAEMYGDSSRCPKCEEYVKPGAKPSTPTPWWIWAFIGVMTLALVGGLVASALH